MCWADELWHVNMFGEDEDEETADVWKDGQYTGVHRGLDPWNA